jgi:hypothetical protein
MNSSVPSLFVRDFYDRFNDRGFIVRGSISFVGFVALLIAVVTHPRYMQDKHEGVLLVMAWGLLAMIVLALRRLIVDLVQGYRGMPALRLADEGMWSRRWSRLGWIRWSDISAVAVVERPLGKGRRYELRIDLRDSKYKQLPWNDQLAQLLVQPLNLMFGSRIGPRTLWLASSTSLTGSWERLVAALAALGPILDAHGVWRHKNRGG